MTADTQTLHVEATADRRGFFKATRLELVTEQDRATIDAIASEVEALFSKDLEARPSRHVYVTALPERLAAHIARIRDHVLVPEAIRRQYPEPVRITPMPETDELYISHYNKDLGGDHGLFAKHYDGNLRFVPIGTVVRLLVYVRSTGNYEVVFGDSDVAYRFRTYDLGLLDFHRELHWVEGQYEPGAPDRVVLKINYLVVPERQRWAEGALSFVNLFQFRVVKAAMEYSKSPKTPSQRAVGLVCNVVRVLNNVHPVLPHVLFLATGVGLVAGVWAVVSQLLG